MATTPGILTDWPWTPLGSFKHVVVAPWIIHGTYSYFVNDEKDKDLSYFLIFPFMLWRFLHNQLWISLSRYRTAKGNGRIVDKGLEFEQVDRERNWDDQILFNGILFYLGSRHLPGATNLPFWRTDGVILTILLHAGPVEFLYYWLHRALHHHFLYSRYHSHHHSSIVTEPITSVIHPFAEHISYFTLFAIPLLTTILTGTSSIVSFAGYVTYIDFMNNMGHCNFELIPKWLFTIFPPLKYLLYTPSHRFDKLRLQTWAIPKYSLQYFMQWQNEAINGLIEDAILEAEEMGVKVLSLGLLNQGEELNRYGGLYVQRYPHLKIQVVDGSSLAVAVILNSIPKGTTQVVLRGKLTKVAYAIAHALSQKGVQVATLYQAEYLKLTKSLGIESNLVVAKSHAQKIWLVDDGLTKKEQMSAPKGTLFVPFSQFPPKQLRKDCSYHYTPAMKTPTSLENVHACEFWLPRRVMSAWRVAGIVHALEGWKEHDCGYTMSNIDKVWQASLVHGFQPLTISTIHTKNQ
ncbi:unnamed protein product [Malus baccata var. baccata]